jgi:beta-lactamase class A
MALPGIGSAFLVFAASALAGLTGDIQKVAADIDGTLGAAVILVETGEQASFNANERFPMQSVYKAPIAMAVLHDVDAGRLALDAPIRVEASDLVPANTHSPLRDMHPQGGIELPLRELLRAAVMESDGTASDVLLRVVGGKPKVEALLVRLGAENMKIATTEAEMARDPMTQYRSWAAPLDAARWLARLQEGKGLTPASRDLLLGWMTATTTFPTRLKGQLPRATPVAHKTGSSGMSDGLARATNDVGIITLPDGRHLAVAVFLRDSRAPDAARDAAIARVARAAWDRATGAKR